jgi:hypothetical protein
MSSCIPPSNISQKLDTCERIWLENSLKIDELKLLIIKLDESYRINQTTTNQYEKSLIKKRVQAADIDALLDYIRNSLRTEDKAPDGN